MDQVGIVVRALSVEDLKNGEFRIMVPAREVSESQRKVLRELFPNFCDQAYDILTKEALVTAIVPVGDEAPIPSDIAPKVAENFNDLRQRREKSMAKAAIDVFDAH